MERALKEVRPHTQQLSFCKLFLRHVRQTAMLLLREKLLIAADHALGDLFFQVASPGNRSLQPRVPCDLGERIHAGADTQEVRDQLHSSQRVPPHRLVAEKQDFRVVFAVVPGQDVVEVVPEGHLASREALEEVVEGAFVALAQVDVVGGAHVERVPQNDHVPGLWTGGTKGVRQVVLDQPGRAFLNADGVGIDDLDARKLLCEEGVEVWQRRALVEERPDDVLRKGGAGPGVGADEDVSRQRLEPEDLSDLVAIELVLLKKETLDVEEVHLLVGDLRVSSGWRRAAPVCVSPGVNDRKKERWQTRYTKPRVIWWCVVSELATRSKMQLASTSAHSSLAQEKEIKQPACIS